MDDMLDIKEIRKNPEKFRKGMVDRGLNPSIIDEAIELDRVYRAMKQDVEELRHQLKIQSKEFFRNRRQNESIKNYCLNTRLFVR